MSEDRSCHKGGLEVEKGGLEVEEGRVTLRGEVSRSILVGELSEQGNNARVIEEKTMVEVGKAEKGLDVLHLTRLWPIGDDLYLVRGHGQAIGRQLVSKIFGGRVELALLQFGIEAV